MSVFSPGFELGQQIERRLKTLGEALRRTAVRGFVQLVKDSGDVQFVQLQLDADNVRDDVEHFQPFGLAGHPLKDAQGLVFMVAGNPRHLVAMGLFNPDKRPKDLEEGATALYDAEGVKVHLKPGGGLSLGSRDATKGAARVGDTIKISMAALNAAFNPGSGGASFTTDVEGSITEVSSSVTVAD
jgi:phage baseplate assembly protein V